MGKRTAILAGLVFLVLAGGLAAYLLIGQDSEAPTEEAQQGAATNPETTAGAAQPTTEATTTEETTQEDTNTDDQYAEAADDQYAEATVEEIGPTGKINLANVDETNLEEATPQESLALYYRYMNEQAWESAYGLLSSQSQQQVSPEQFVTKWQNTRSYKVEDYTVSSAEVRGDLAELQVEVRVALLGVKIPGQSTRQMVREDGIWRVVLSDREVSTYN